jgi:hypothetical protein
MQPIIVTEGVTRNSSGQKILPVIDSQNYSLLYVSTNGSRIYSESSFFGDGLSATGQGGALAEEVLNNLQQALSSDLTGFNYIFIQSEFIGWEGTSEGPTVNSLYYYNGGSGPSSTGDVFTFYDSAGNEWKLAKSVAEQVNEAGIATNTQAIADNATNIAANAGDITDNATAAATAQAAADAAQQAADEAFSGSSFAKGSGSSEGATTLTLSGGNKYLLSMDAMLFTANGTAWLQLDISTNANANAVLNGIMSENWALGVDNVAKSSLSINVVSQNINSSSAFSGSSQRAISASEYSARGVYELDALALSDSNIITITLDLKSSGNSKTTSISASKIG